MRCAGFSNPAAVASRDSASTVGAAVGLRGPSLSQATARSLGGGSQVGLAASDTVTALPSALWQIASVRTRSACQFRDKC